MSTLTVIMGLLCCTCVVHSFAATPGIRRDGSIPPNNRSVNIGPRQAQIAPHTIIVPVVDRKDLRFRRLSTEDGLSQTHINAIAQDDQGFMWFASMYGLNRYDGYKFKVFKHEPDKPNSLSGVHDYSLFKDRSGALWVGCEEFLDKFDPVTETAAHYHIGSSDGETFPVRQMSQDHTGMLWLATRGGLFRFNPSTGQSTRYQHDPNDPFSLSSNEIKFTGEDREGTLWVAASEGVDAFDWKAGKVTLHIPLHEHGEEMSFHEDRFGVLWIVHLRGGGLAAYDRKTNTLTQYSVHSSHNSDDLSTGMLAVLEDRDGTLWFGTMGNGILEFDRKGQRFIRYRHDPGNSESLGEDDVSSLFQDREGNIWAGLHMMAPNRFATRPPLFEKFKHEPGNPNSFSGTMVNGIYEDRQGILWIGAIDALNRVDRKTGKYTFYRIGRPQVNWRPTAIVADRLGFLWVGSDGQGLFRFDPKTGRSKVFRHNPMDQFSLSSDYVIHLLIDHAGRLWATTFDGLDLFDPVNSRFTVYKAEKESATQVDADIKEYSDGALWIGTGASGVQRFDPRTHQFTVWKHDANGPKSLSNNSVSSVYFDHSGDMWVGTQDGLDKFDRSTGTFKTYYEQDGLSGNLVSCILEDERSNLWIGTNNGISKLDALRQTFKRYSTADGLPGADFTGFGSCFKSSSGEMFFGGFSGGIAFYPDKVVDVPYIPPVVLSDFRLFGRPVTIGSDSPLHKAIGYTNSLSLSHNENIFSLEFSALSFFNPETNRYRYKLEGLDRQWNEVGSNQRLVTYTTLPAGKYTFRMEGATSRGAWSEPGLELSLNILPAWWNTWWFRGVCAIFFVALLWILYRWRIRRLQGEERRLRDVVETIPAMTFTALSNGSSTFVNKRWTEYTGLSVEETSGAVWERAIHPEDLVRHSERWRVSVTTGQPFEDEARFRRASDGGYRWFLVRGVPLRNQHGKIIKWYGTLTDIEDRKRAEQEREKLRHLEDSLAHINRVSMLGEMAASLAHEIKQPITAAITSANSCVEWLTHEPPNLDRARVAANKVDKYGNRAAEIIDRIRSLYRKSPSQRELVDVNEVVREIFILLHSEATKNSVVLRAELAAHLPRIKADRVQLQQVFMNLMLNAIEAMQGKGGELLLKSQVEADGRLLFSVTDTGVGLPTEKAEQIFSPFFTTKPQGSGMGLAISRSIVESHGGQLWATANNGHGATFHFTLPVEVAESSALTH